MRTEIRKPKLRGRGNLPFATERDRKILHFIWKWKLASTATIHEAVGRPSSDYSTYKTLERLARLGLVESINTFEYNFSSWQLTMKGFQAIKGSLGDLSEEGFLSANPWHDRNALALQLGEWSTNQLPIVSHVTDQDMRCRSMDYYPQWVPQVKGHRPDGYTKITIDNKNVVLAYEAELWAKSVGVYETILKFYGLTRHVQRIFWLVGEPAVKENILRAKTCIRDDSANYHVFVKQQDYMEMGWDAPVTNERSETLFTIRENMRGLCGTQHGDCLGTAWGKSMVSVHYDKRKVLGKKRT